jgi:hypothetical protein
VRSRRLLITDVWRAARGWERAALALLPIPAPVDELAARLDGEVLHGTHGPCAFGA